ncbi:MAG: sigma-54-dependent transcriptional regulator [Nitrospiraceae bacterium]
MSADAKILVAEDDAAARELLVEALKKEGYGVEAVAGGREAIERGRQTRFDLVLTDIKMGDVDGFAVLRAFREFSPDTSMVLLTSFGSMEGAVEAIKQGVYDYLAKPFKKEEIKLVVRRGLERSRLLRENAEFRQQRLVRDDRTRLVGASAPMVEVFTLVARVAPGKSTVLLRGESGTGKELVARAIHINSPRRDRPFVAVSCAALSESLLESELFGHEKGAFTGATEMRKGRFELADGGTLFLDEIGDVSPAIQVKLLRVLQERTFERVGGSKSISVDVRVISATHRDLTALVKEGKFREDLFYRLNVVQIVLPPLRERGEEEIKTLAQYFLQKYSDGSGPPIGGFHDEAMGCLQRYAWPGNVRELENVIERVVSLSQGPQIVRDDLPDEIRNARRGGVVAGRDANPLVGGPLMTLDELERHYLGRVLKETQGNKVQAAKLLGIDRRTLYRMAERFGLDLGEGNGY